MTVFERVGLDVVVMGVGIGGTRDARPTGSITDGALVVSALTSIDWITKGSSEI